MEPPSINTGNIDEVIQSAEVVVTPGPEVYDYIQFETSSLNLGNAEVEVQITRMADVSLRKWGIHF
jgi:hypothetical protein